MDNKTRNIKISKLEVNQGQIDGLPKNPRFIRDERFKALVKSIQDAPEMLSLRELLVVEHGNKFVVIGGNMRLRACKELGYTEVPCKVLPADTPTAKLREYAIKDNNGFGQDDWDILANEWDAEELADWGVETPMDWSVESSSEEEIERKAKEFQERMEAGEIDETDEEYQEFLEKFRPKKTTDDCYTPDIVYEAVADWVSKTYKIDRRHFERPFYPGGDYQKTDYPDGCVVVDNPPFSILAEILRFYTKRGIKFFLFAPTLTLFSSSSSSTALPLGVGITYDNGASVSTSFLTNLEPATIRIKSYPELYDIIKTANDGNLRLQRKEIPRYDYPDYIVTATRVAQFSRYGVEFAVPVSESKKIGGLDSQKASGKGIYGSAYIVSERVKNLKKKAEREKAEREKAEREKAERWELSPREMAIVESLNAKK